MIRRRLLYLIPLLISFTALKVFASAVNPIEVVVTGCPEGEFRSLAHLLAVETSASSPETAAWIQQHRPQLSVRCVERAIRISLENNTHTILSERAVHRGEAIARDMPRYVALAAVELIASVASVLDTSSAQPTEKNPTEEVHDTVQPPSPGRRPFGRWSLGALAHGSGIPFDVSFGGVLEGEILLPARLCVAADVQFTMSKEDATLGSIRQTMWSGALALLTRFQATRWAIRPGIGFRGGRVHWKGEPKNDDQTIAYENSAPWGGPFIALLTSGQLSEKWEIAMNIEIGYTLFEAGALVNDSRELSLSGVWGMFSLGIGTLF